MKVSDLRIPEISQINELKAGESIKNGDLTVSCVQLGSTKEVYYRISIDVPRSYGVYTGMSIGGTLSPYELEAVLEGFKYGVQWGAFYEDTDAEVNL